MPAMTDESLSECIETGQWRCTVEEVQETAARLLKEKQMWERQAETSRLVAENAYHKMSELLALADLMALTRNAAFPLKDELLEAARKRVLEQTAK